MVKGSSEQQQSNQRPIKLPERQNEYTYINGRQVSSSAYDSKKGGYVNTIDLHPDEQRALNTGRQSFANLLDQVDGAMAVSPQERQSFIDALYQPQERQLTESYHKGLGDLDNAANASGVMGSIGHQNYAINELTKNYNNQKSDLYRQAELAAYELPSIKLNPIQQALGIFDSSIQQPTARGLSLLDPSFQGRQASNNFENTLYSARMQNALRQDRQPQSSSFFSSFF